MYFRLLFLVIAVLSFPLQSIAQEPDRNNAATHYKQAFDLLKELRASRPGDFELLVNFVNSPTSQLTPDISSALKRLDPVLSLLRMGASSEYVDFGIDYSLGPATLLPHLSPMRLSAQLLVADARAKMLSGDIHGAAQSLSVGYQMSDHTTDNPVIINSLVGASIFSFTNEMVQRMLGEGMLNMADARILFETVNGIANEDPLGFVASIDGEHNVFGNWLIETYGGEDGKEKFIEDFPTWMGMEEDVVYKQGFADMSIAELKTAIHLQDLAYVHMSEAARMEDLDLMQAEIKQIQEDAVNGLYGPFASIFMPALDNYVESMISIYGSIDEALNDLKAVATDPDGAAKVMNAAIWYLRAINLAESLSGDIKTRIDMLVDTPKDIEASKLSAGLPEAKEIIKILTEGSKIKRCNFDLANYWERQGLLAKLTHLDGMGLCGRILVAEINSLYSKGGKENTEQASEHAATCMRMVAHLTNDKRVASVDALLDMFTDISNAITREVTKEEFNSDSAQVIIAGMGHIKSNEPFGFNDAMSKYYKFTIGWFIDRGYPDYDKDRMVEGLAMASNDAKGPPGSVFESLTYMQIVDGINELDKAIKNIVSKYDNKEKLFSTTISEATTEYESKYATVFSGWFLRPLEQCAIKYELSVDKRDTLNQLLTEAIKQ